MGNTGLQPYDSEASGARVGLGSIRALACCVRRPRRTLWGRRTQLVVLHETLQIHTDVLGEGAQDSTRGRVGSPGRVRRTLSNAVAYLKILIALSRSAGASS